MPRGNSIVRFFMRIPTWLWLTYILQGSSFNFWHTSHTVAPISLPSFGSQRPSADQRVPASIRRPCRCRSATRCKRRLLIIPDSQSSQNIRSESDWVILSSCHRILHNHPYDRPAGTELICFCSHLTLIQEHTCSVNSRGPEASSRFVKLPHTWRPPGSMVHYRVSRHNLHAYSIRQYP